MPKEVCNLFSICLNPDNEILGGEAMEEGEGASDRAQAQEMGVRTAERFLKELRFKPGLDYKYRLMENCILLGSKVRANVETALENLTEMDGGEAKESVQSVGAVLGIARCHLLLKQTPRAKQELKRLLGFPWNMADADYLEQGWLLLSDLYINQGKLDVASEILATTLRYNQSSVKVLIVASL